MPPARIEHSSLDPPGGPRRAGLTRPVLLLAGTLLISACGSAPAATEPSAEPTAPAETSSASRVATSAVPEPVIAEGDCFYLDTGFVEETVGQRISRTTYTSTSHEELPGCTFYRPDGEPAVDVAVTALSTAVQAQNAAVELGTPAAIPVDDIADGGVVLVATEGTVLAVSSGRTLLVVRVNQQSSLEARAIAAEVAPLLG